jgi:hypothetical protein
MPSKRFIKASSLPLQAEIHDCTRPSAKRRKHLTSQRPSTHDPHFSSSRRESQADQHHGHFGQAACQFLEKLLTELDRFTCRVASLSLFELGAIVRMQCGVPNRMR